MSAESTTEDHGHGGGHDHGHDHHDQGWVSTYLFSTDHKVIAMQYMFTGMAMAIIGGFFAYVFRMQLAFPGMSVPGWGIVTPTNYNSLVTNHGTIMIFWVAMPVLIAAFGNYLIPLMCGCDDMVFPRFDMVFPRLNRLSYQIFLLSAIVLLASFFMPGGGFGGAWTAYPPLSADKVYNLTPWGAPLWVIAVALEFVAFLIGGINFVTTAMNARAKGMTMWDVPMIVWMICIASILFMASVGPLVAGAVMLLFDQLIGTAFYSVRRASAGDGNRCRDYHCLCAQEAVRLQAGALHRLWNGHPVVRRLGASSVHLGHRPTDGAYIYGNNTADIDTDRGNVLCLHRHAVSWIDHADHADALGAGVPGGVPSRRCDRYLPRRQRHGYLHA
jgi:hypothetical protein